MIWRRRHGCSGFDPWFLDLLKFSVGLLTLSLCDVGSCSQSKSSRSLSSSDSSSIHSHVPFGVWGTSENRVFLPWDEPNITPNIVPLSLKEHGIRQRRKVKHSELEESRKRLKTKNRKNREDETGKGKSGSRSYDNYYSSADAGRESSTHVDLALLKQKALDFGSLAVTYLTQESSINAGEGRSAKGFMGDFANAFKIERKEGGGEGGSDRGVIDWLARLIGVQGKTLGEFLREYQVHVLYDLVFTFFKWIFFLYAGLLIP